MSTSPIDLPVLISQLPFVSKLATAEQTHPEVRQEVFAPLLLKEQRKEQEKVQRLNKREKTEEVKRDQSHAGNQYATGHGGRETKPEEHEAETTASNASPWAGNIVNVKI